LGGPGEKYNEVFAVAHDQETEEMEGRPLNPTAMWQDFEVIPKTSYDSFAVVEALVEPV